MEGHAHRALQARIKTSLPQILHRLPAWDVSLANTQQKVPTLVRDVLKERIRRSPWLHPPSFAPLALTMQTLHQGVRNAGATPVIQAPAAEHALQRLLQKKRSIWSSCFRIQSRNFSTRKFRISSSQASLSLLELTRLTSGSTKSVQHQGDRYIHTGSFSKQVA